MSRTLPIPGLAEHGIGFKSLPQAIALRNRLIRSLELAETLDDPDRRREYLTFVVVGAGYAGVEGVAELQDFAADVLDLYPRCAVTGMRWILVEAQDRLMQEAASQLGEHAARELRGRGIELRTSTTIEELTARSVTLAGGEVVPTRTLVWTAGVKPHPIVARLGLPVDEGGRLRVDRQLRVEGHANVWAVGDGAAVPYPAHKGRKPTPPTAQHALRQGRLAARNVAASIGTGRVRPFRYKTKGFFAELGRREAVAATMGIRWRGLPAFLLTRTYHLVMMPGMGRRWRLLADWNVGLLFGRDTAELGQLGQPPSLAGELQASSAGGTGEEAAAPREA